MPLMTNDTEYLRVNPGIIRDWFTKSKGGISAYKIGKQWKFKCSKLDDWITSGKVQWNEG